MVSDENYPTDLTDSQWEIVEAFLPEPKKKPDGRGRPCSDLRRVLNGILYTNRTGCQWRLVPKCFGHWNTVYSYFNRWSKEGVWERIMEQLRHRERTRQGRLNEPSGGCVDSQSVKTMTYGDAIGYDGGKKTKGRKQHILVDTLGLLIAVVVTAANQGDREGLMQLLTNYFANGVKRLRKLWVDGGYNGSPLFEWVRGLKKTHKIELEVVGRIGPGF